MFQRRDTYEKKRNEERNITAVSLTEDYTTAVSRSCAVHCAAAFSLVSVAEEEEAAAALRRSSSTASLRAAAAAVGYVGREGEAKKKRMQKRYKPFQYAEET